MADDAAPIIVLRRKKNGHGGHHGGAWKVAYADFVTAMMALFIVLWLMNAKPEVQKAVGGYFRDPKGHAQQTGNGAAGSGEDLTVNEKQMASLKEKVQQALNQMPEFQKSLKDKVEMSVTAEGLRIELLEDEQGVFFDSGNAHPTPQAVKLISVLAGELGKLPNPASIEGHTDARKFSSDGAYGNWELSADRANAARRLMQASGVRADQITQVRGFADQRLRLADRPQDAANRRISVLVHPLAAQPAAAPKQAPAKSH